MATEHNMDILPIGYSHKGQPDQESTRTASETTEVQESIHSLGENSVGERKSTDHSPAPKNSMKSRIKALITEEMSKRRGRHRRSTSYPTRTQLDRTISIHRVESSDLNSRAENNSNDDFLAYHDSVHSAALLDPFLPRLGEENGSNCELCAAMLRLNYLKQSEVNKLGRQPVRDHTLLGDKLIYAIEQRRCNSLQESKLFMDALDLLNLRKEVFLKILQDPSSSLAHQLHCRRTPHSRFGLTKSESFPVSGSSSTRAFELDESITVTEDNKHLSTKNGFSRELELSENASPTSADVQRKRHDNKVVVLKRFKNLREKIKHVIRDRKKRRIGLLWTRDAKDHTAPDGLRFRTADNTVSPIPSRRAVLGRILSLPDLRSYSAIQIDDSSNISSSHRADDIAAENTSIGSSGLTEQKPLNLGLENKVQPCGVSESPSQENLFDVRSSFDDSADSKTWETASSQEFNLEPVPGSVSQPLDSDQVSEDGSNYQEDEKSQGLEISVSDDSRKLVFSTEEDSSDIQHDLPNLSSSENTVDVDTLENQVIKKFYTDLLHFHVDTKNEAEFNYVKDVLELSGFSRDEILGKWHSAEHPVNPLVFEEVEGCLVSQPECSGNEEGGSCNHLLLFDLINEVLLDIHERSFCYWPVPLTNRSHIHQMPKGYRVLEEVWAEIRWLLSWPPEIDQSIDDAVSRDLGKGDGWMNLQLDAEFVGLEVEDLIFDDLLEEIILT
ncbi:hypothetical protein DH2020_015101 [Rehmannia glutinosa]|uniref:DUF4378 domain-containing protein n=1 Tax=Rehmannia glutinosa TaxID=99300 RepID=A0ABR0WYT9_REHGL